ncbi:hypothetical protein FHR66_000004 [Xanthomonas sp. F4]
MGAGIAEIGTLVFDVHDGLVIDPTEERLREEFGDTKTLHLPMQSINQAGIWRVQCNDAGDTSPPLARC